MKIRQTVFNAEVLKILERHRMTITEKPISTIINGEGRVIFRAKLEQDLAECEGQIAVQWMDVGIFLQSYTLAQHAGFIGKMACASDEVASHDVQLTDLHKFLGDAIRQEIKALLNK